MRFKRHAKNKLRRLKGTWQEAESVVANPIGKGLDDKGNALYLGYVAGVAVWVVVADEDPEVVITVFKEGRG